MQLFWLYKSMTMNKKFVIKNLSDIFNVKNLDVHVFYHDNYGPSHKQIRNAT